MSHQCERDEHEAEALKAQDANERARNRQLVRHPDCRDPDHAGCERCLYDDDAGEGDWK